MNRPSLSHGKHPVQNGQFELQTPRIKTLREVLGNWLDSNVPGGMVVGNSRSGKSWAIRYFVKKKLPNSKVPIVSVMIPRDTKLTENQFYALLLEDFGYADPNSGRAFDKWKRLVEFLKMIAERSGEDAIYIFIDDAHVLHEEHFSWLSNLYDQLYDKNRLQVCFVLFAEPTLIGRRDSLRARNREQVIARLLTTEFNFKGVDNVDELKKILNCYDEFSEYPQNSGWNFSQYYFPEAFSRGWRLEKEAEILFQAFKQAHEKSKVTWPFVIPMQYLISSIKYALLSNQNESSSFTGFSFDQWEISISFSSYINAGTYLCPQKRLK